jgi:hypothetical protein
MYHRSVNTGLNGMVARNGSVYPDTLICLRWEKDPESDDHFLFSFPKKRIGILRKKQNGYDFNYGVIYPRGLCSESFSYYRAEDWPDIFKIKKSCEADILHSSKNNSIAWT